MCGQSRLNWCNKSHYRPQSLFFHFWGELSVSLSVHLLSCLFVFSAFFQIHLFISRSVCLVEYTTTWRLVLLIYRMNLCVSYSATFLLYHIRFSHNSHRQWILKHVSTLMLTVVFCSWTFYPCLVISQRCIKQVSLCLLLTSLVNVFFQTHYNKLCY